MMYSNLGLSFHETLPLTGKGFVVCYREKYEGHLSSAHGAPRLHSCSLCNKMFAQRSDMYKHRTQVNFLYFTYLRNQLPGVGIYRRYQGNLIGGGVVGKTPLYRIQWVVMVTKASGVIRSFKHFLLHNHFKKW